jgi:hypothetical protein
VEIPLKIPIHEFFLLSGICNPPSVAGRWEIGPYFSAEKKAIAPIDPALNKVQAPTGSAFLQAMLVDPTALGVCESLGTSFRQFDLLFRMFYGFHNESSTPILKGIKVFAICIECR